MVAKCSYCSLEANVKCACNRRNYCAKDYEKHKKKKGDHEAINLDEVIPIVKKSVSFAGSDDMKKKDKVDEPLIISVQEDKKRMIQRVLELEIAKLQKFKAETVFCLGLQQQNLIKSIVNDSKALTSKIIEECKVKEELLQKTNSELEVVGKLPLGHSIIERIKKTSNGDSILKTTANLKPTELKLEKLLDFNIQWIPNPVIEDLKIFFDTIKLTIPSKLKKLYEKIFNEKHYSVKKINLSKSKIDKVSLGYLLKVVNFFPSIKELRLSGNKINSDISESLAECLTHFKEISKLDLSDNDLRGHGIEVLTPVLIEMKSLTMLSVARNNLGATGSRYLSLMLENLKKIKELDLDGNALGSEGARYLSNALPKLSQLKILKLRNNNLVEDSFKFMKAAFGRMQNIESLRLEGNRFGNEQKRTMQVILRKECKVEF